MRSPRVRASHMLSYAARHEGTKGPSIPASSRKHPYSAILDSSIWLYVCILYEYYFIESFRRVHFYNMYLEKWMSNDEALWLRIHSSIDIIHLYH